MKPFKKLLIMSATILALAITGCSQTGEKSEPSQEPAEPRAQVFVLTGQSNMEGNTRFSQSDLNKVFTDLGIEDGQVCFDGIPEVQTSYYGCGYGQIYTESNVHASNNVSGHKIDGKFLDTKVGMGNSDSSIGPELGMAYVLKDELTEDKPVYFIKCGISGSGFAQNDSQGDKINWNVEKDENLYLSFLKPYTQNCLKLIEDEGKKPVIKAFLWNQGESDADSAKIPYYNARMNALLGVFKEDFMDYAPDQDGDNIAFIDALIYEEGKDLTKQLNDTKLENIAEHSNYYYVDATKRQGGLSLTMGGDNLHYDLKSIFRLGMAYGQAIIDNDLLD